MTRYRAIAVREPLARLLMTLRPGSIDIPIKDIENRNIRTIVGARIAIAAPGTVRHDDVRKFRRVLGADFRPWRGQYLGTVMISAVVERHPSDWRDYSYRYGWEIRDPWPLERPIPVRCGQSLWSVDPAEWPIPEMFTMSKVAYEKQLKKVR